MSNLSEIDLGSAILSVVIVAGFIATAFAFIRLTIIGVNYINVNYLKKEVEAKNKKIVKNEAKGF
tara:strand:+ start:466 stop:660 length:195 start_codon:yes stop_codon:yes gene_type:complete